mgnify:CR=1 FL=1
MLSWQHLLIVLIIVLLVFGTKKLRNIGQDLGGAIKGFKDGIKDANSGDQGTQPKSSDGTGAPPQVPGGQTIEGEVKDKTKS